MAPSNRYTDLQLVQKTPTGDTFRANHVVLGRPVLIRTIEGSLDEQEIGTILDIVRRTSRLVHPNILSVIDAELDGDEAFYVTDYVIGSLKERMGEAPFPVDTVARWGLQLLRAIGHANAHDVIHRGLSPWRIHFDQIGSILIADFGLSAAMQDRLTGTTAIEVDATPYLPVRVLRSPASYDERADRYGVAALIVEVLTGAVPESGRIDTSSADGDVPAYIVTALEALLTGVATTGDLESATDAFKRWVHGSSPSAPPSVAAPIEAESGDSAPRRSTPPPPTPSQRKRSAKRRKPAPVAAEEVEPPAEVVAADEVEPPAEIEAVEELEPLEEIEPEGAAAASDEVEAAGDSGAGEAIAVASGDGPPADESNAAAGRGIAAVAADLDIGIADRAQEKLDRYAHLFD